MKKFLIIGNINAVTYKEVFPLIKENKMWLGIPFSSGNAYFYVENVKEYATGVYNETTGLVKFRNCHWFTNLDHDKRNEKIDLYKHYNPEEYPKYDNYDAIEVSKVCNIPIDYYDIMSVPITFFDKYCPEQFEIIGYACSGSNNQFDYFKPIINGKHIYKRLLIKRR